MVDQKWYCVRTKLAFSCHRIKILIFRAVFAELLQIVPIHREVARLAFKAITKRHIWGTDAWLSGRVINKIGLARNLRLKTLIKAGRPLVWGITGNTNTSKGSVWGCRWTYACLWNAIPNFSCSTSWYHLGDSGSGCWTWSWGITWNVWACSSVWNC